MNIIELHNIQRSYVNGSQSQVLKNINLQIASGEMVAIIGPSGSGKSTLLNILGCLDAPDSGDYLIGGKIPPRSRPMRWRSAASTSALSFSAIT